MTENINQNKIKNFSSTIKTKDENRNNIKLNSRKKYREMDIALRNTESASSLKDTVLASLTI
jgi:hypothetical protein